MKTNINFWSYLSQFFLETFLFWTLVVENIETHILCLITCFQKLYHLWDNVDKYCRVVQAIAGYLGLQIHTQVV